MSLAALRRDLKRVSTPARAKVNAWFFKTGKGEYGEGDVFMGISMPDLRMVVKKYHDLPLRDVERLLASTIHEERMAGLVILTQQYARNPDSIYRFYLSHTDRISNWDLVDVSAPNIVGEHLLTRPRAILNRLAHSKNLWERRIAIVSTLRLIRNGELDDAFRIAKILLTDRHDLTHKATGWMLREAGKKDLLALRRFLRLHAGHMPRMMLRYAIERMVRAEQKRWRTHSS